MKNASFKVNLEFNENDKHYTKNGLDTVEFLISSNVGEPLKPLSKIASVENVSNNAGNKKLF